MAALYVKLKPLVGFTQTQSKLALIFILSCLLCTWVSAGDDFRPVSGVLATITFSTTGEPICVPVTIGDTQSVFIVDTGTAMTCLDPSLLLTALPTGRMVRARTGLSSSEVALYQPPKIDVAGISCDWLERVCAVDLKGVRERTGTAIKGILGSDFLSRFVLHVDPDSGVCLLCDPDRIGEIGGERFSLTWDALHCPTLTVGRAGGADVSFVVATGYQGTGQMRQALQNALFREGLATSTGIPSLNADAGGILTGLESIRWSTLHVGQFHHTDLVFDVGDMNILGLHFISRYKATFDFKRDLVFLTPGDKCTLRDRNDFLGMIPLADQVGNRAVIEVVPGSISAKAGFLVNDILVAINGKPISQWSTTQMLNIFTFLRKEELRVTVKRGLKTFDVIVPGG